MQELKELLKAVSSPRMYLQLGNLSLRGVLNNYLVVLLFLQGVQHQELFQLYGTVIGCISILMLCVWRGVFSKKMYQIFMKLGLVFVFIGCMAFTIPTLKDFSLFFVFIIFLGIFTITNLNGVLTRSDVQKRASDTGMALFQILIPLSISVTLFITGMVADKYESSIFYISAGLALILMFFSFKYRHINADVPCYIPLTQKAKALLFLDIANNIGFMPVVRLFLPIYIALVAKTFGLGEHTFKLIGLVTSILILSGLVQQGLKSKLGKWKLPGRKLLYTGMFGMVGMNLVWGILGTFTELSIIPLILIGFSWIGVQIFAPLWNMGFFTELKDSVPNGIDPHEANKSYHTAFSVALNIGSGIGAFLAAQVDFLTPETIGGFVLLFSIWSLLAGLSYIFYDQKVLLKK